MSVVGNQDAELESAGNKARGMEAPTVGSGGVQVLDKERIGNTLVETPVGKKRLPSSSPEHSTDDERSGSRKFSREDSAISTSSDCVVLDNGTDSLATNGHKGSVFYRPPSSIDTLSNQNAMVFSNYESLEQSPTYQRDSVEVDDSLLYRLKDMVKSLDDTTKVDVACQSNALYLTPLVKTLFSIKPMSGCGESSGAQENKVRENEQKLGSSPGRAIDYTLENNLFLRAIAQSIGCIQATMNNNTSVIETTTNKLETLSKRFVAFESFADKSITSLEKRVNLNTNCTVELHDIAVKTHGYVDEKFSNVGKVVSTIVQEKCNEIEPRLGDRCKELFEPYRGEISSLKQRAIETSESHVIISETEWQAQRARLDSAHELITGLRGDVDLNTKRSKNADVNARKNNLIIDKLGEIDNENIEARLNEILNNTLTQNDRAGVVIVRAFRLGRKQNAGGPRKIMVELTSSKGRDIVLANTKSFTKSGNNGKAIT